LVNMADTDVKPFVSDALPVQMEDVDMADDSQAQPTLENENGIPDTPSEAAPPIRKRPKLDLSGFTDATGSIRKAAGGERRKGKSIFGVALGTLNKAKVEERLRMSSEAAKKRQEIDARLQAKLAREQDIIRKQDGSRKDRIAALRKQEDLSIKDSILKHRYLALPHLSSYLSTSDVVPSDVEMDEDHSPSKPLDFVPKPSHPPALYYLPKILTPSQEAFVARRRKHAEQRVAEEKEEWETERRKGLEEVRALKVASEAARTQASEAQRMVQDDRLARDSDTSGTGPPKQETPSEAPQDREMSAIADRPIANDAEPAAMEGIDDDAVEY